MIDDHENKTVYDLSTEALRANCKRPMDVEKQQPFAGSIFFVQVITYRVVLTHSLFLALSLAKLCTLLHCI